MKNQNNWINSLIRNFRKNNESTKLSRKKLVWLLAAVVLGISMIILGSNSGEQNSLVKDNALDVTQSSKQQLAPETMMALEEESLASKLQSMLESIDGAGTVKVTVRLASSSKETYAINTTTGSKTTTETDQGGGNRTINENNDTSQLVMARDEKGDIPVIEMESSSEVAGVLVVSSGAVDPIVKETLFEAVQVALSVEPHRIIVLTGK